jgi:hypothetical protein
MFPSFSQLSWNWLMQKDTLDVWRCIRCTVVSVGVWWCMVVFGCTVVSGGVWWFMGARWCMVVFGGVIIQALVAELVSRRPLASSKVVQELEVEGVTCRWRWRMTSRVCVCGVGGTRLNCFICYRFSVSRLSETCFCKYPNTVIQ